MEEGERREKSDAHCCGQLRVAAFFVRKLAVYFPSYGMRCCTK